MKKVPTDFRRVTMMVSRMEPALTVYRDILGMEAYYDQEVEVSVPGAAPGEPRSPARLVILKCNDPYIGMLGLMELLDTRAAPRRHSPRAGRSGVRDAARQRGRGL
jgi:hypothetical protein